MIGRLPGENAHPTTYRTSPVQLCSSMPSLDQIVLDQIRTVDKQRLVKRMGIIDTATQGHVSVQVPIMFS